MVNRHLADFAGQYHSVGRPKYQQNVATSSVGIQARLGAVYLSLTHFNISTKKSATDFSKITIYNILFS